MKRDVNHPQELIVYECKGSQLPKGEPVAQSYLGIWSEPPFYYLFFCHPEETAVSSWLNGQPDLTLRDVYRLDYEQWQDVCHRAHRVGPFLIRTGPGPTPDLEQEGTLIELSPGVAFGTGVHPTTKGCLLTLADLFKSRAPRQVVDFGTGTGILAIACGRLGAAVTCAVDCVPLAARETKRNILANGLEKVVHTLVSDSLSSIRADADLLLMNIEWPCLTRALREERWTRFRSVILSGFLSSQWDELRRLIPSSCRVISHSILDDWVTAVIYNEHGCGAA
jgi:ribosomal protein L11 methyltransferase